MGIGPGAQVKHHLKVGDVIEGLAKPVSDVRLETVRYYKVTGLKVTRGAQNQRPHLHRGPRFLPS